MSYFVGVRYEIHGMLTCESPVHVGGWDSSAAADLTVARDGAGRPYLPGTSIAGAVRAHLASAGRFDPAQIRALFGYVGPGTREGAPSWLRFDDAPLIDPRVTPVIRDGAGIDRRSASAAQGFLYTREVLPAGTRFALRIVADTPTAATDPPPAGGWPALIREAVDAIVKGLTRGDVPIGAGRGRGFGRVVLSEARLRESDLSDPAGLVAWLTGTVPEIEYPPAPEGTVPSRAVAATVTSGEVTPPGGRLKILISWRPVSPVLVRDSVAGTIVDTLPLTATRADGTVRLLLPGSSIRGAIRAHAERIVRTLRGEDAPKEFGDGLRQPPEGVDLLFGVAPSEQGLGGRRGVLSVVDCHSLGTVTAESWDRIVATAPPKTSPPGGDRSAREERDEDRDQGRVLLREQLDAIGDVLAFDVADHVAIDQWTGGASDHRLFSVLDPSSAVEWEPIELTVDIDRLGRLPERSGATPPALALPLLLLVLRDLRDGWISLGFGGTRGRGQIKVTGVTFEGTALPGPWRALAGQTLESVLDVPPTEITQVMAGWVERFTKETA